MLLQVHKGLGPPPPSPPPPPPRWGGQAGFQMSRARTAAQEAASRAYAPCPAALQRLKALQDRERGRGQPEVKCRGLGAWTTILLPRSC